MVERIAISVPDAGFENQPLRLGVWLVAEGERVGVGDRLVEIHCPGLLVSVTAEITGTVTEICSRIGDSVAVGQKLGEVSALPGE